jgi:hypothetical protein
LELQPHKLFARGWPPTVIPLIIASQVARITGMSHLSPEYQAYFKKFAKGVK